MSDRQWYVVREIPKPPYELTWSGPHPTEQDTYKVCPDDVDYAVWPRLAEPDRIDEEDRG